MIDDTIERRRERKENEKRKRNIIHPHRERDYIRFEKPKTRLEELKSKSHKLSVFNRRICND